MRTRIAIIGLGAVTRNIHLPAYQMLGREVEIVGACDIDAEIRRRMSGKIPRLFATPEEMIEKTRPEIVVICTPPFLHHQQTVMALEAGCHVFCEKPMADDLLSAQAIIRAAQRTGKQVVINTQFPYMKTYQAAKRLIGSDLFGRLLFLHAWQTFRRTGETEAGWRGEMKRRLCFEFGVHVFELVRFFFQQEPEMLFAHMPNPFNRETSDVVNTITLGFSDGRGAAIVLDRLSKGPHRYLEMDLDGEGASMHISIGGELRLEAGLNTESKRPFFKFHFVKGGQAVLQQGVRNSVIAREGINPFAAATAQHFRNFISAIRSGHLPAGNARDNLNTLALAFAAYDSAESGRLIPMKHYLKNKLTVEKDS